MSAPEWAVKAASQIERCIDGKDYFPKDSTGWLEIITRCHAEGECERNLAAEQEAHARLQARCFFDAYKELVKALREILEATEGVPEQNCSIAYSIAQDALQKHEAGE